MCDQQLNIPGRPQLGHHHRHSLHAREVLSDNSGILVKQQDALGIALAIRAILISKNRADAMRHRLQRKSAAFLWPAIGKKYLDVLSSLESSEALNTSETLVG